MKISLASLAELVGGRLVGDAEATCSGANPPAQASSSEITLLVDGCASESLEKTAALALVTPQEIALDKTEINKTQIVVDDPHAAFAQIVLEFRPAVALSVPGSGVHPSAKIDPTAQVHPSATIGEGVTVGRGTILMPNVHVMPNSHIGENCVLHTGVTLYEYSHIADRVVVHAGTVIGANGFGYRQQGGKHVPTAQLGYVHIENDVEIGACVTIDRGTYGATRIGEGTKIDNQVMIAHNCQIGRHNLICSQVGIAGSCQTGDHVILAGQVGLKDHIHLGDQTIVGAQAGVMEDCAGHEVLLGSPATNQREQMQIMATERRLPEMRRELKTLRKELQQLRQLLTSHEDAREAA